MRTREELDQLRDQARSLRVAGKSRREIKQLLDVEDNKLLSKWLEGLPPPEWTKRPNAKDDLREQARDLRRQGLNYKDIAARLHVSLSSVSLWVRDLPVPPRFLPEASKERSKEGFRRYWEKESKIREAKRSSDIVAASAEIGNLGERELLIAGAIAYWCEGEKKKPYRTGESVNFINSDPGLITLFLRFLDSVGISRDRLSYRVHVHEKADVAAATRYWQELAEAPAGQFIRPNVKRHNPRTTRKNVGATYHGCLQIRVLRSAELYRRIEGWASAIMFAA